MTNEMDTPLPLLKGIATIDSILETPTVSLSQEQVAGLVALRSHLSAGSTEKNTSTNTTTGDADEKKEEENVTASTSNVNGSSDRRGNRSAFKRQGRRCSVPQILLDSANSGDVAAAYLAAEYGGMTQYSHHVSGQDLKSSFRNTAMKVMQAKSFLGQVQRQVSERRLMLRQANPHQFRPYEWNALSLEARKKISDLLTWESLCRWDFNPMELAKWTGGKPLMYMGWALLGSPHAQNAMAMPEAHSPRTSLRTMTNNNNDSSSTIENIDKDSSDKDKSSNSPSPGYDFISKYNIHPETICAFLRDLECNYVTANPYHNETHAADVLQTTHALLQFGAGQYASDPLQLFSILLAAAIHDVAHPGTTNAFQVNTRSDVALRYNDDSVLENMHIAHAFFRIMGSGREEHLDLLAGMEPDQVAAVRSFVIKAVRGTDMSRHFDDMERLQTRINELGTTPHEAHLWLEDGVEKDGDSAGAAFLRDVLHLADISGQAKVAPMSTHWTDMILEEFFAQGDVERAKGMKLSPLCDRETVSRPGSQVGFIKFIVKPAYELMGRLVPRVAEDVVPIIKANLEYWTDLVDQEGKNSAEKRRDEKKVEEKKEEEASKKS